MLQAWTLRARAISGLLSNGGSGRAQFKGEGKINGEGNYGFMLTAIDGGKNGFDYFRIKIWNLNTGVIVYDNNRGVTDTANPTTLIAGGSIIVH